MLSTQRTSRVVSDSQLIVSLDDCVSLARSVSVVMSSPHMSQFTGNKRDVRMLVCIV